MPRRFQFRLSYLIYLITLSAIGFAVLRHLVGQDRDWVLNTSATLYVLAWIAYFGIRVPILWRRMRRARRQIVEHRQAILRAETQATENRLR